MTLRQLTSELFLYLAVFRRKVAEKVPLPVEEVSAELDAIFARMDERAAAEPAVNQKYASLRKTLAIAADGIVVGADWDKALDYLGSCLEKKHYRSNTGGDAFYEELSRLPPDDAEAREILFLALSLGFRGRHAGQPEVVRDLKARLYATFPGRIVEAGEKLTPQTYEHTDERDCTVSPVERLGRYAIILGGIVVFVLLLGRLVYDAQKSDIHERAQALQAAARDDTR